MQGLGERIVVDLDVPQTVINFGAPGLARNDPDFITAYVVNHIFGVGSHTSRLYSEVREKRGLAYSIRTALIWMDHANILSGGTATRADRAGETLSIIEREAKRMAEEGPDAGGARQGEGLSEGLLCARLRHIEQDRRAAGADPARQARHRLSRRSAAR